MNRFKGILICFALLLGEMCLGWAYGQPDSISFYFSQMDSALADKRWEAITPLDQHIRRLLNADTSAKSRIDTYSGLFRRYQKPFPLKAAQVGEIMLEELPLTDFQQSGLCKLLSSLYGKQGYRDKAIALQAQVNRLYKRMGKQKPWEDEEHGLAHVHAIAGDWIRAAEISSRQYRQTLRFEEALYSRPSSANATGVYFRNAGVLDSAVHYFEESFNWVLEIRKGLSEQELANWDAAYYLARGNIGSVYLLRNQYAQAITLLQEDYSFSKRLEDWNSAASAMLGLAEAHLGMQQPDSAVRYLQEVDAVIEEWKMQNLMVKYLKLRAGYQYQAGNKDQYHQAVKLYQRIQDSITRDQEKQKAIRAAIDQNLLSKTEKISRQEEQLLLSEELSRERKLRSRWLLGGLVLTCILLAAVVLQYRKQRMQAEELRESRQQIAVQNEELGESLGQKERLLKEIHHRLKNNLQIISSILEFQGTSYEDDRIRSIVLDGQNRVQSIALIHQRLYESENLETIAFLDYLKDLVQALQQAFGQQLRDRNIELVIDAEAVELSIDTVVPLGLIVNELITNSFKHAFPNQSSGTITIRLRNRGQNEYVLEIMDDGVGLPEGFDLEDQDSLGLDLVQGLSRQINGAASVVPGSHAHFQIQFADIPITNE